MNIMAYIFLIFIAELTQSDACAAASTGLSDHTESMAAAVLIGIGGLLLVYFSPTLLALLRKKSNALAIGVLNLFLGWTLVGWVIALVWAVAKDKRAETIVIQQQPNNSGQV